MKHLAILFCVMLTACGGGSESKTEKPSDPPGEQPSAIGDYRVYEYYLRMDGDSREYSGVGVRNGDVIYFYPRVVANSSYSVIAEATFTGSDTLTIRLFDLSNRGVVRTVDVDHSTGDGSDNYGNWYSFELYGEHEHGSAYGNFQGVDEYGIDPTLCYYDVDANDYAMSGELYSCGMVGIAGNYRGSVQTINDKTIGVMTNDERAVVIIHE